ncbi:hypothetical protein GSI_04840 [Ganoderma sinense ZZ0214-1]|uniref:Uncharacterized protein n=1 Tax=Ganoderma sinense ZZ0214-1 TaxID=1077348 RepID=A0A2G8SG16_9APHY|nr:hypothetical protein GSI_04840 [Ganoderma sinense ZZ0214-1]
MTHILSRVRAPRIRTLVLFLWRFYPNNVDRAVAQLGVVADAVSKNNAFRDLERVVVRLVESLATPISKDVFASVRNEFKPFADRGLLSVESNKRYEVQWVH